MDMDGLTLSRLTTRRSLGPRIIRVTNVSRTIVEIVELTVAIVVIFAGSAIDDTVMNVHQEVSIVAAAKTIIV